MMLWEFYWQLFGLVCLLALSFWSSQSKQRKSKYKVNPPPGPWGFPILGHLPNFGTDILEKLMQYKQKYGPIISLRLGSFPAVMLSDATVIKQAMAQPEFSGRPLLKIFVEPSNKTGIALSDGAHNVEQRHFALRSMKDGRLEIIKKMEENVTQFVKGLTDKLSASSNSELVVPVNNLFNVSVINSVWSVFLGHSIDPNDLEVLRIVTLLQQEIIRADRVLPTLALFIPFLDHILNPLGMGTRRKIRVFHEIYNFIGNEVEKSRQTWTPNQPQSISHEFMDKVEGTQNPDSSFHKQHNTQTITFTDIFLGSIETISVSLEWWVHYMAEYPEVQRKCQEEISQVIGGDLNPENNNENDQPRLPSLEDREKMPYCKAMINELLRFSSIQPIAFYRAMKDTQLSNYTVAKDTIIMTNFYAAHFDPKIWGDPQNFRPERWLTDLNVENGDGKIEPSVNLNNQLVAFSAGKRACVGQQFARDCLFSMATGMLQRFTIETIEGAPKVERVFGLEVLPSPFSVRLKPRSKSRSRSREDSNFNAISSTI